MGVIGRLFRTEKAFWHGVTVMLDYTTPSSDPVFELEEKLRTAIDAAGVGEFLHFEATLEWDLVIFEMHGPDADRLYAVARPVMQAARFMHGAEVTLRYGPDVKATRREKDILKAA